MDMFYTEIIEQHIEQAFYKIWPSAGVCSMGHGEGEERDLRPFNLSSPNG